MQDNTRETVTTKVVVNSHHVAPQICLKCGKVNKGLQYNEVFCLECCNAERTDKAKHPPQVDMAGGKAASTKGPAYHLIPTVALTKLAERFELGIERKGDKAWNALSSNQECLTDKEFLIERCSHIIHHALKLRDQLQFGEANDKQDTESMTCNASAIAWGGVFLTCAADALEKQKDKAKAVQTVKEAKVQEFNALFKGPWSDNSSALFKAKPENDLAGKTFTCINGKVTGSLILSGQLYTGSLTEVGWNPKGKAVKIDQSLANDKLSGYDLCWPSPDTY